MSLNVFKAGDSGIDINKFATHFDKYMHFFGSQIWEEDYILLGHLFVKYTPKHR